jgi:carbon-monoxide dehydrogenase medium subunit
MKPAEFEYYAPTSLDEALELLAEHGYDVKVLAGGQSLIPAMNFRMALPPALLDLNNVPELFYIRPTEDGGVAIGAMTRDSAVEFDPIVKERFPVIVETMPAVAHPQIRNRGTFGGNIAHGDPTAQLPAVCLALNAQCRIMSKNGERWEALETFYSGPFTPNLESNELLVEVMLPPLPAGGGASYQQMARQAGAQALVGVCAVVGLDAEGRFDLVRIAMTSVGETPLLASQAMESLIGQAPTPEAINAAAKIASQDDIDPGADIHTSVEYRRHLAYVLTVRALTEAVKQAGA